jgi:hypothetical protein
MKLAAAGALLILSFVIIAGCVGSSPANNMTNNNTTTNHSILPTNPGYLVYTNDSYDFSIEYPANWTVVEGGRDVYSNPPETVTNVVTFYPPHDNLSSQYDGVMVAFDQSPLGSSGPITLTTYMDYGIKHYYEELPYKDIRDRNYTNISIYPAIRVESTYYYNTWVKLHGETFFIISGQQKGTDSYYHATICRLEYRTSDETFDNHLETAMRMIDSFKFK